VAGFTDGYSARTIFLHPDGKPASVSGSFGMGGNKGSGGCSVDSLNQSHPHSGARPGGYAHLRQTRRDEIA
jgi:hypothetical protein